MATRKNIETVIYIRRTANWHITMDRQTRDFAAFADVDGQTILIGFYRTEWDAERACRDYTFEGLVVA